MSENPSEIEQDADESLANTARSKGSAAWKFVGGCGLGISVPLMLIGMSTADDPDTVVNEPSRLMWIAGPILIISLFFCYVDQIRARLRG